MLAEGRSAMSQSIVFVSTCPICKHEQPHDGFTVAALVRLLKGGHPIEAYCETCDEFWPVDLEKRVELGDVVAVVCGGTSPLTVANRPSQSPSEDMH